ncbi:hypothetical protein RHGRI_016250 [Rhododendron griersonianum]|uniref:Uncharacterized protein n=1 Tax=Rhododendron griersonianum TaxID=479676 RepID=A0AAV6JTH6_9ERIC|nr:hypothetical protein RHGRI_016250 [Rhododendron griersonianum]
MESQKCKFTSNGRAAEGFAAEVRQKWRRPTEQGRAKGSVLKVGIELQRVRGEHGERCTTPIEMVIGSLVKRRWRSWSSMLLVSGDSLFVSS